MIRAYWHLSKNFGDTLTPIVVGHFTGQKVVMDRRNAKGKLLAIGSILTALRENDVVWGSGLIRNVRRPVNRGVKILAVRGPLTLGLLGVKDEVVYGDPGILLPRVYNPNVEKKYKVGMIPHSVEKEIQPENGEHRIDIDADWKTVIEEIKSCERIVSSSLHGIVCAEAYGIPAEWVVFTNKVIGNGFKFRDYLQGTGRKAQDPGEFPPIEDMEKRQDDLIKALTEHFK